MCPTIRARGAQIILQTTTTPATTWDYYSPYNTLTLAISMPSNVRSSLEASQFDRNGPFTRADKDTPLSGRMVLIRRSFLC